MNRVTIHRVFLFGLSIGLLIGVAFFTVSVTSIQLSFPIVLSGVFGFTLATAILLAIRKYTKYYSNNEGISQKAITILAELVRKVPGLQESEIAKVEEVSHEVVQKAIIASTYYRFFRYSIGAMLALASFAGTYLLLQQNIKIQTQTDLMRSQTDLSVFMFNENLRNQLLARKTIKTPEDTIVFEIHNQKCSITIPSWDVQDAPNQSRIEAIYDYATSTTRKEETISALRNLVYDSSDDVSLGALMVLDKLEEDSLGGPYYIDSQLVTGNFDGPIHLIIRNSFITGFSCKECFLEVSSSYIETRSLDKIGQVYVTDSFFPEYHCLTPGARYYNNLLVSWRKEEPITPHCANTGHSYGNIEVLGEFNGKTPTLSDHYSRAGWLFAPNDDNELELRKKLDHRVRSMGAGLGQKQNLHLRDGFEKEPESFGCKQLLDICSSQGIATCNMVEL